MLKKITAIKLLITEIMIIDKYIDYQLLKLFAYFL